MEINIIRLVILIRLKYKSSLRLLLSSQNYFKIGKCKIDATLKL